MTLNTSSSAVLYHAWASAHHEQLAYQILSA